MKVIGVDGETLAFQDLNKVGSYRYLSDPGTDCFCFCYRLIGDEGPVKVWFPPAPCPPDLYWYATNGYQFSGWNVVSFDRHLWDIILVGRWGFPKLAPEQWIDSMHLAAAANLPRSLEGCAKAVGLSFDYDLKDSRRIKEITNKNKRPYMRHEDAVWLLNRCVLDVQLEESVFKALPPWSLAAPWHRIRDIDRRINDRGVMVDLPLVHALEEMCAIETQELSAEISRRTGEEVNSVTKVEALKRWLLSQGVQVPVKGSRLGGEIDEDDAASDEGEDDDTEGDTGTKSEYRLRTKDIESLLGRFKFDPNIERVMNIRREAAKASTKKLKRIIESVSDVDHKMRGLIVLGGAQATLRFSSSVVQIHNFPREVCDMRDFEDARKLALARNMNAIRERGWLINGKNEHENLSALQFSSRLLRRLIMVPDDCDMPYADYSQIEARITSWLAGERRMLDAFAAGKDVYKIQAALTFNCRPEDIADDSTERQIGKAQVLFLGFMGGMNAFIPAAMKYGVRLSAKRAAELVTAYREANQATVDFSNNMLNSAISAVATPGHTFTVPPLHNIAWYCDGQCLYMELPGGRRLRYWQPRLSRGYWPDGREKRTPDLSALSIKGKAVFRRTLWRGLIVENAVQATAVNVLVQGLANLEDAGFPVVVHVHDAAAAQVRKGAFANLKEDFTAAMTNLPQSIYKGLPIAAKTSINRRFG